MNAPLVYIILASAALIVLVWLAYATARSGRPQKLTLLSTLAFLLILAGILLGQNVAAGYGLIGLGILLAIIDILRKSRGPVG